MIAKLTELENGAHWDTVLEQTEYTLNNTVHRSFKEIPSKMLFGVQQKGEIVDELREGLEVIRDTIITESLEVIRVKAMYNQNQAQACNKTYFDKAMKKAKDYAKGVYFMVKNFVVQREWQKS